MYRRFLFPLIAVTALAQQTPPASAEAETVLRSRVQQFYQLEVDKDFRHAEALVAEDSKDYFYGANKPKFENFHIAKIELTDHDTKAKVTVDVRVEVFFPGSGAQVFELPSKSNWKLENGTWSWYFDKDAALNTPFGKMTPGPAAPSGSKSPVMLPDPRKFQPTVVLSRRSVALTEDDPVQTVTVTNGMPGPITLTVAASSMQGVTVEVEKNELRAGEIAGLRFRLTGNVKASGLVRISCSPIGQQFDIRITAN